MKIDMEDFQKRREELAKKIVNTLEEGGRIENGWYGFIVDNYIPIESQQLYDIDYDYRVVTVNRKNIYRVCKRYVGIELHYHPFDRFDYQYDDMYIAIQLVKEQIEYKKVQTTWERKKEREKEKIKAESLYTEGI